jgi:hypothetical protein
MTERAPFSDVVDVLSRLSEQLVTVSVDAIDQRRTT